LGAAAAARMKADLIGGAEAAYRIEAPEGAWLDGVLRAARPLLDAEPRRLRLSLRRQRAGPFAA